MKNTNDISLPLAMIKFVKNEVKTGNHILTRDFFRKLIREWRELRLLRELRASQKEFEEGKGKILHSLKDLR